MKLPSLKQLVQEAIETFERFPFAILSAFIGTAAVMIVIQREFHISGHEDWLYNIGAVAFLGISLFIALQLISEKKQWNFTLSLIIKLGTLCLLTVYYFLLPQNIFQSESVHLIRYFLFIIAAHLFAVVAPFTERGYVSAFWEFNKSIFQRLLTSALYTGVLFTGLSIALLAIDHLFAVNVKWERYMQLWWFLVGVFNTWFFLSGVPRNIKLSETEIPYPKGLKVFTQYVMIPLVVVYVCILYAYMGKIVFEWDWPKGWVGYLVLGFSITGIFSLLLIHPIKNRKENKWMAIVWQWFYVVILPLVALLMLAIWRRISEYGLTERRYFVIVLGLWLAVIALYFLLNKTKSIKIIPISLCAIAILVSFGPWGAFSISENNQVSRLKEVLVKNNLFVDGKAKKAQVEIPFDDAKRINEIVRYLAETHDTDMLQSWFNEKIDSVKANRYPRRRYDKQENAKRITQLLGVRYIGRWERSNDSSRVRHYSFRSDSMRVVALKEFKYLIQNIEFNEENQTRTVHFLGHERWDISLAADSARLIFVPSYDASKIFYIDLKERLFTLNDRYAETYEYGSIIVSQDLMMIPYANNNVRMQLFLQKVSVDVKKKHIVPTTLTIDIVMTTK